MDWMDRLLDQAWTMGVTASWGTRPVARFQGIVQQHFVAIPLPDKGIIESPMSTSYDQAAFALMAREFPDPSDLPDDPA